MDEGAEQLPAEEEEGGEETTRANLTEAGSIILPQGLHGTGAIQIMGEKTTGYLFPCIARLTSEWAVRSSSPLSIFFWFRAEVSLQVVADPDIEDEFLLANFNTVVKATPAEIVELYKRNVAPPPHR